MDSKDIKIIKAAFHQMKTKEDFLALLNLAKPFVYGDKAVPFELKQLTWYANPNSKSRRYTEFKIKKKSGAERSINAPVKGLKAIQKTISFILQCVFEPHKSAMGFAKDKSVVDNAKIHEGNNYVYNIDLKDFFSSIDQARVWKTLQLKPFNLFEERAIAEETLPQTGVDELPQIEKLGDLKYLLKPELKRGRLHLANMIASLCCAELEVERKDEHGQWKMVKRNVLPQGAPSSPVVTNIICQKLDHRLSGLAKRFGLKYSRYADDITFSSMHNVYQNDSDFITELNRIIADQNFHIKDSKTRLQKEGYRQEVTGLLVNDKANVQKRYVKQLRMWLYYWERYGLEKATNIFTQNYTANKSNLGSAKPNMTDVIKGKLDYLKMVKGGKDKTYLKLRERYDHLIATIKKNKAINPTEVTNDDIIEFYGGIEEIKKLAEESKVFIDRVRNNNNANHEEAPPVNPQEREETEIPRWTIKELTEYIKKDPELSKHILRKNKKAKDYSQQKQQPKSEEPKVSEPHPFASIPGLIKDPDEMDELLDEYYGSQENLLTEPYAQYGSSEKYTGKIRINIDPMDSANGQIKLRRKIIIDKGENLPLVIYEDNHEPHVVIKNHRPRETKSFLSLFNNSEGLKYLTHKFNDGKRDYHNFIQLCKNEFDEGKSVNPNVPFAVLRRIEEFAFAQNPEWYIRKGNEKIFPKKGWGESSFIEWYKKDFNIHPGWNDEWNNEMIIPFKESIEVRAGNLLNILNEVLNTSLGASKSNFDLRLNEQSINESEFYTDVDKLKLALGHIFSTIKERANKNFCFEIEIDFINETLDGGDFKKILITHINSEPTKHSNDKDFVKGDMKTIQSNLWGLCNYEIAAKFPDGFRKKIILTDDYNDYKNFVEKGESIPIIDSMKVKGFTHILKFY